MPVFTIKEIEEHRIKSGKGAAIVKTLDRGRKFREERYISADSIFTKTNGNKFSVKGTCRASMKKDVRSMNVTLDRDTGKVIKAYCTCPAGNSGYCNHVMALLFELADYSLHQIKVVPEEVACTSKQRQWGVPGDKFKYPQPVMNTAVQKQGTSKGILCTVYDPRINSLQDNNKERIETLNDSIRSKDMRIGFGHVIDQTLPTSSNKFGNFSVGSPLSYQLSTFESNFKVVSNIKNTIGSAISTTKLDSYKKPPLGIIPLDHECVPNH